MLKLRNRAYLQALSIVFILLLVGLLLWHGNATSMQAQPALVAQVYFDGEYRIAGGPWQPIVAGQHIPATRGDVTLRGNFHLLTPDGEYIGIFTDSDPIAFYLDHISVTFYKGEDEPYVMDVENPLFGKSACSAIWLAHSFYTQTEEPIEILIHNPHRFGNEKAIDELLASIAFWTNIDFEKNVLESGEAQRNVGLFFAIVSLALLGIALFSTLIHINKSKLFWLFGLVSFCAGAYFIYSANGISFRSASRVTNTIILGSAMILYMFFLTMTISQFLAATKQIGTIAVLGLGLVDALLFVLPVVTDLRFYDTWFYWVIAQLLGNTVLLASLVKECFRAKNKRIWLYVGAMLPLLAFGVDVAMTALGIWKGGAVSLGIFVILFVIAMVVVLRIIPDNINAAAKARELELQTSRLEAELKENRIAIMLSQIQPHFIYNTLGTIERMCLKDPQKAFDLVRNFSLYLRGNFSELTSVTPIQFAEELKHVEYYANIEKVRFPDMTIEYAVEATDFVLPALSVQPLVENAIKHGLMRLESGGTVVIHSYETPTHFCVEVKDDGMGFDTDLPIDEKKHVGLRNIRGRLKAMVGGQLILESRVGVGTKALIMIPKEVTT